MSKQFTLIQYIFNLCLAKKLMITSVESCTGGLISSAITDIEGSSKVFDKGLVTYSNESKTKLVGVSTETILKFGAVSQEVVTEMATQPVVSNDNKNLITIATSGVAGPAQSENKPVGLIWIASYRYDNLLIKKLNLGPLSRYDIREQTVTAALSLLRDNLNFN